MAKHAGNSKAGKNKIKCERYTSQNRRVKNKLPRVLQSNGAEYAAAWARENSALELLQKLLAKRAERQTSRKADEKDEQQRQ